MTAHKTFRASPQLSAIQERVQAQRRRRGDAGYVDAHVKAVAIHLVMEDLDLSDLTVAASLAIGAELGLSVPDYVTAVEWIDPDHASRLRHHAS